MIHLGRKLVERMALANGIELGHAENEPGSVPHLPLIRRLVPDTANVPTAKGVLNSNFRCEVR